MREEAGQRAEWTADPNVEAEVEAEEETSAEQLPEEDLAADLARSHSREELLELAAEAEPGAETRIEDDPTRPFWVGVWSHLPNWCCRECPFATTGGPQVMLRHIADKHTPEGSGPSGLFGPNGEPL